MALQHRASPKPCGVVPGMELGNFRRGRYLYLAGRRSRSASAHILVVVVVVVVVICINQRPVVNAKASVCATRGKKGFV